MGRKSHCRCANQYAKPIFMCRKCVGDFLNVRTYYHALDHRCLLPLKCTCLSCDPARRMESTAKTF